MRQLSFSFVIPTLRGESIYSNFVLRRLQSWTLQIPIPALTVIRFRVYTLGTEDRSVRYRTMSSVASWLMWADSAAQNLINKLSAEKTDNRRRDIRGTETRDSSVWLHLLLIAASLDKDQRKHTNTRPTQTSAKQQFQSHGYSLRWNTT